MQQLKAFNSLTQTRHGLMLAHTLDKYVGMALIKYGEFAPRELLAFESFVRPGDVVIDGGANQGALALPLSRMVGDSGLVICFEPQRLTFQVLNANMALNCRPNVMTYQLALGAEEGTAHFERLDLTRPQSVGSLAAGSEGASVPVVTVDSLGLPRLKLLKLDVEGAERAALRGAAETIARCQPVLYVENDKLEHELGVIDDLLALGYRPFWHLTEMVGFPNWRGDEENVFERDGEQEVNFNLLCLPPGDPFAMAALILPALEAQQGEGRDAMLARVNA
jgi:FkbM family methyltransferase